VVSFSSFKGHGNVLRAARRLAAVGLVAATHAGCGDATSEETASAAGPNPKPEPVKLGLNDVSVLYPLPASDTAPGYLKADDEGAKGGTLLPKAVYDAIPTFPVTPKEGLVYDKLRVVSLRFDGCGGSPDACKPELRLVMQPINANGVTRDSALHLFYRLEATEFQAVVDRLRELRVDASEATVDGPLEVHPALVLQGVEGTYGTALRALVLANTGADNLVRATFFLRAPPLNDVWFFGGLEPDATGAFVAMNIVGVGKGNQRVILTRTTDTFDYALTPNTLKPEDGRAFYSTKAMADATDEKRRATMESYLRVENPLTYVPDAMACAPCHLSAFVTAEASRLHGLKVEDFATQSYQNPSRDLTMRGGARTNVRSMRAFGYFGGEPMIAQRTINDTAAVLDAIEAKFPPKAE
jgi:hypothetical protein